MRWSLTSLQAGNDAEVHAHDLRAGSFARAAALGAAYEPSVWKAVILLSYAVIVEAAQQGRFTADVRRVSACYWVVQLRNGSPLGAWFG